MWPVDAELLVALFLLQMCESGKKKMNFHGHFRSKGERMILGHPQERTGHYSRYKTRKETM